MYSQTNLFVKRIPSFVHVGVGNDTDRWQQHNSFYTTV